MNVFIFHGTMGSPESNWFPWLKQQLINQGIKVFMPQFPTPEGQNLENWRKTFAPFQKQVDRHSVFVGHSMGAVLALRLLEQITKSISKCVLVAPFYDELNLGEDFDKLLRSFINHPFEWEKIKNNCNKFIIYAGDDDPYVPLIQPHFIAKKLGVNLNVIPGGKHLNEEAGYWEFPAVLAAISMSGAVPLK